MKPSIRQFSFLALLAIIFTIGLTFASVELPRLLDTLIGKNIDTLDVATGLNTLSDYKTELYMQYYDLRLIGYSCLALVAILIVIGFATGKVGFTSVGALVLFLPVFGHFAATMFFLGGLGMLRLIWLPFLDVSFNIFRFGEIIILPYEILGYPHSFLVLNRWIELSYVITGTGLLIFFFGTMTWFYARMQKRAVADVWIYRFSRHPQYLGWIIWSYGVMFLPVPNIKQCYELSNSLPWLLSTLIIIGVAMLEELKMGKVHGESYESYRRRAPLLFPLPSFIVKVLNLPQRLLFRKDYPERKREIVAVLAIYTVLLLGISVFYGGFVPLPERKTEVSDEQVETLARVLKDADNFGEKRRAAGELEKIGEPAMESLIALLSDNIPQVRAYSAGALGGIRSERVVPPLITLLHDSDSYVRRTAAGSLGRTGSHEAIQPLAEALRDQRIDVANAAASALGKIRHPDVVPLLIGALRDTALKITWAAAVALGELGASVAIEPIVQCYEEMSDCPYHAIGDALWRLNSDRAIDVWITGLKKGSWWFSRASCATALGKNKLEVGIGPLEEALKDASAEVRRAAVLALMEFRSEKTINALRGVLKDKDFEVRMYTEEALKKIGSRGMIE